MMVSGSLVLKFTFLYSSVRMHIESSLPLKLFFEGDLYDFNEGYEMHSKIHPKY